MRALTRDEIREYKKMDFLFNATIVLSNVFGSLMFVFLTQKDGTITVGAFILICVAALAITFLMRFIFRRTYVRQIAARFKVDPDELVKAMGETSRPA